MTAQIKFQLDEKTLLSDACAEFFDAETGVVEFPVTLTVANQELQLYKIYSKFP